MGFALDEQKTDNDNEYQVKNINILIDKKLAKGLRSIEVDYRNSLFGKGFIVNSLSN